MSEHLTADELTAWVEIDRGALAHNLGQVRSLVGPEVRLLAVVKANAYGHGAVAASRAFLEAGADFLGVTRVEEALELRDAGITAPILVFGAALPHQAGAVLAHQLSQTVCTLEAARALSAAAQETGRTAAVHLKIDTGMGRLGIRPDEALEFVRALRALPGIRLEGIYTHFATALERERAFMQRQLRAFLRVTAAIEKAGLGRPLLHAANSAALLRAEVAHLDMVRPGTVLYGQYPAPHLPRRLDLRPTWRLKSRVAFVKQVQRVEANGYGRDYVARAPLTVATIPVGYCDGLTLTSVRTARSARELLRVLRDFGRRGRGGVQIRGKQAPFVGRVAMQMCCVDVTHIPDVQVGDEVILPARFTLTDSRLPRVYR